MVDDPVDWRRLGLENRHLVDSASGAKEPLEDDEIDLLMSGHREMYEVRKEVPLGQGIAPIVKEVVDKLETKSRRFQLGMTLDHLELADERCVLVDSSLLTEVERAILGGEAKISASQLLDLSALTVALVCYDFVLFQSSLHFQKTELMGPFQKLMYPSPDIEHNIWPLLYEAMRLAESHRLRVDDGWRDLLGLTVADTLRVDFDAKLQTNAKAGWDDRRIDDVWLRDILKEARSDPSDIRVGRGLGLQTVRAIHNELVAQRIGVPYLATSIRAPFQSIAIEATRRHKELVEEAIVKAAGKQGVHFAGNEPEGQRGPYAERFGVPFLLATVFSRMQQPSDYPKAVATLREELKPFRDALRAVRASGPSAREDFLRAITSGSKLKKMFEAAEMGTEGAVWLLALFKSNLAPHLTLLKLGFKALRFVDSSALDRVYAKYMRPELQILITVAEEAKRVLSLQEPMKRLWPGSYLDAADLSLLEKLSRSQPWLALRPILA